MKFNELTVGQQESFLDKVIWDMDTGVAYQYARDVLRDEYERLNIEVDCNLDKENGSNK